MPVKRTLFIVLMLSTLAFLTANLVWDAPVALRQGVNIEWFRTGAETDDGGAIYVWSDTTLGGRDLWAQKVDATGNMVWGDPVLIDGKDDRQEDPVITKTSDGNFIIAWIDFFADADGDVYAQKINSDGELLWQEGGKPVCTYPNEQISLNIEADNDGGAFLLWADKRNIGYDIYGQRISSTGDPLWAVNGIPIADGPGDEFQNTMLPDGIGGMMVGYVHKLDNDQDIFAKHFDADGNMTWDEAIDLAVATGDQSGVRVARLTNGEFVFAWTDQRNTDSDIYGQKVNLSGQKLWSEPYIIFSDQDAANSEHQNNVRLQATTDNAVVAVWEDKRLSVQNTDLFAQKIAANGDKLWNPDGVAISTAEFNQEGARLSSDGAGGVFIVWDDHRNGNSPNEDIYAQRLSADGVALWEEGGKAICNAAYKQNSGLIKVSQDMVYINWMDIRNGSVGIYYQVVDFDGNTQLQEDGVQVFWGLSGDVPQGKYQIFPRQNDVIIVWEDTRFADVGSRVYYQILDPDGNAVLETNGVPITLDHEGSQDRVSATLSDNDELAVVWRDNRLGYSQVYAQLISSDGTRAWDDNGLKIIDESVHSDSQTEPRISYYNDSFYIGWREWFFTMYGARYQVYGQRIQNGERLWDPAGVEISLPQNEYEDTENQLDAIVNDVYLWVRFDPMLHTSQIMVKKVNADDGSAATPLWGDTGIFAGLYTNAPRQLHPEMIITPSDHISVLWRDQREGFFKYFHQLFTPEGEKLYASEGIPLTGSDSEQDFIGLANTNTGTISVWAEVGPDGEHDVKAKKYFTYPDVSNWDDEGIFVVERERAQSQPTITAFDGGGSLVAWTEFFTEDSDIFYNFLNPNGSTVFGNEGSMLCDNIKSQYMPTATTMNNNAYVVWADGLSSGKTEILGLYAQKVSNQTISTHDQSNAPALNRFELSQNYPNPFNPTTTIALNMAQSEKLELSIYNSKGQLVRRLHSGDLVQGDHIFVWNGKDSRGNSVASGVYFYKAESGSQSQIKKMLLMK